MKYEVTYTFNRTASYDVEIEAESAEQARLIAESQADDYENCNIGCRSNVVLDAILELDSNCEWDTSVTDISVEEKKTEGAERLSESFEVGDTFDSEDGNCCPMCDSRDTECTESGWDECGFFYAEMHCRNCHGSYTQWLMPSHVVIQQVGVESVIDR